MWVQDHAEGRSMNVRAEVVGWSLLPGEGGLSGLSTDEHPARNAFTGAGQILHHIQGQHQILTLMTTKEHFLK
jgi:hypothetical protein